MRLELFLKWKAHEKAIISLSYSQQTQLLASASEDSKYKIWDSNLVQIHSSLYDEHISSIDWSPDGKLMIVCGFNTIILCDANGVTK